MIFRYCKYILLILICLNFISCKSDVTKKKNLAEKGIFYLSEQDLQKNNSVALNGDWEFYWKKLYTPQDFITDTNIRKHVLFFDFPECWQNQIVANDTLTKFGFATYRLIVKTDAPKQKIAFDLQEYFTSYKLFFNGQCIAQNGVPGKNTLQTKPDYYRTIAIADLDTLNELIFQIANFDYYLGGPFNEIKIGKDIKIVNQKNKNIAIDLFLFGSIIIMVLYHLGLFVLRPKDKSTLYFGLFTLCIAVRTLSTGEQFINNIFPSLSWYWGYTIDYLTYYCAVPTGCAFLYSLFPKQFNKKILAGIIIFSTCYIFPVIIFNPIIFSSYLEFFQIVTIAIIIYCIIVLIKALINKAEGAGVIIIGMFVAFLTVINDIVYARNLFDTIELVSFGIFILVILQSYVIAKRFSKSYNRNEELTKELNYKNENLERIVAERTAEIQLKKEELERNHKRIKSSITYAKRIQKAVFQSGDIINMLLPNSFIFFKPKDVVSGDFYFIKQIKQYTIIAAADCTGHGIPGAFMSMLGIAILDEIVRKNDVESPSFILNELRIQIKNSLQQTGEMGEQQDGMDIALCTINLENYELKFSGAHNPFWLFRKQNNAQNENTFITFPADRQPVGVFMKEKSFSEYTIALETGDIFYLFSDGYYSQFGGKNNMKFKTGRFKALLSSIHTLPVTEQKEILEKTFYEWKGKRDQTDDVLIIGIRI